MGMRNWWVPICSEFPLPVSSLCTEMVTRQPVSQCNSAACDCRYNMSTPRVLEEAVAASAIPTDNSAFAAATPFGLCLPRPCPDSPQSRQHLDGLHCSSRPTASMVMHLHRSYAEKVQEMEQDTLRRAEEKSPRPIATEVRLEEEKRHLEERLDEGTRRLEERIEQLRAEKERLLYDLQLRGRPLDDGDDRSAIRRGLQAGSKFTPLYSPPPSLPPGPPSSEASWPSMASSLAFGSSPTQHTVELTARSAIAPVPLAWGEADRHRLAERACGWSRVVADSGPREQLAAETLVDMATGEEASKAAVQQRSTVDSPSAPNQPVLRTHAVMPVAQQLQYRPYTQTAAPPCCSVRLQSLPVASPCSRYLLQPFPRAYLAWAPLQRLPAASARDSPPGVLKKKFETLVMCDFTPRRPSELQTSRWVNFKTLFRLFQPHAPAEVWLLGPGNLKQLITKWYKDHPAFAGLDVNKWCKRQRNNNTQDGPGSYVFKFCFECTPNAGAAI